MTREQGRRAVLQREAENRSNNLPQEIGVTDVQKQLPSRLEEDVTLIWKAPAGKSRRQQTHIGGTSALPPPGACKEGPSCPRPDFWRMCRAEVASLPILASSGRSRGGIVNQWCQMWTRARLRRRVPRRVIWGSGGN